MSNALRSSTPAEVPAPTRQRRHAAELSRRLCRDHAGPLLTMATLILDDVDAADGVVVDAIVATCRRHHGVDLRGGRVRALLARSVYRRCVGALAMRERFSLPRQPVAPLGSASASPALAWMSERQRCTMALTLFGGLSLPEAARTLELPPARVVCHLQDILTAMSTAATVSMSEPADRALTTLEREPTVGATIRWA